MNQTVGAIRARGYPPLRPIRFDSFLTNDFIKKYFELRLLFEFLRLLGKKIYVKRKSLRVQSTHSFGREKVRVEQQCKKRRLFLSGQTLSCEQNGTVQAHLSNCCYLIVEIKMNFFKHFSICSFFIQCILSPFHFDTIGLRSNRISRLWDLLYLGVEYGCTYKMLLTV
jgi:hypothetical protein